MRDKLIELLCAFDGIYPAKCSFPTGDCKPCENLADYLIAHGVTFAEDNNVPRKWIPVSERLPDPHEDVLVYDSTAEEVTCGCLSLLGEWFGVAMKNEVTHWMPLPETPKEDE